MQNSKKINVFFFVFNTIDFLLKAHFLNLSGRYQILFIFCIAVRTAAFCLMWRKQGTISRHIAKRYEWSHEMDPKVMEDGILLIYILFEHAWLSVILPQLLFPVPAMDRHSVFSEFILALLFFEEIWLCFIRHLSRKNWLSGIPVLSVIFLVVVVCQNFAPAKTDARTYMPVLLLTFFYLEMLFHGLICLHRNRAR